MGNKKSMFPGSRGKGKKKDKDRKKSSKKNKNSIRVESPEISIRKSERDKMKRLALQPIEVPDENQEIRNSCNHQTDHLTVEEFERRGFTRSIVPMLDQMEKIFGKNNVQICSACYDTLLNGESLKADDVQKAICTLYAAVNYIVSNGDLGKKEIQAFAETKNAMLDDWQKVLVLFRRLRNPTENRGKTIPNRVTDEDLNQFQSVVTGR